ncbi:MAG TPA: hypothetical protein VKB96_01130, partial [Gammaproteobacteria bacterium]|nr:hypothetical protein [Gammaproteobacteria bacterium]
MTSVNTHNIDDRADRSSIAIAAPARDVARRDKASLLHRFLHTIFGLLSLRYANHLFLCTVGYWFTGELGLLVGSGYASISPLWPAAGLALFAFLVAGTRVWPGVVLGSLFLAYTESIAWPIMLVTAGSNVVEAM